MTTPKKDPKQGTKNGSPKADNAQYKEDLKNREEQTEKSQAQLKARKIRQQLLEDDDSDNDQENVGDQQSEKQLNKTYRPPLRLIDNIVTASNSVPTENQPKQVPRVEVGDHCNTGKSSMPDMSISTITIAQSDRDKLTELCQQLKDRKILVQKLESDKASLQQQLTDSAQKNTTLGLQLSDLNKKLIEERRQRDILVDNLKLQLKQQVDTHARQQEDAKQKLERKTKNLQMVEQQLLKSEEQRRGDAETASAKIQTFEQEKEGLLKSQAHLEAELRRRAERIGEKEAALQMSQAQSSIDRDKFLRKYQSLLEKYQQLEIVNKELERVNAQLKNEKESLAKELEQAKQGMEKLRLQLDSLTKSNQTSESRYQQTIKDLESANTSVLAKLTESKKEQEVLTKEVEKLAKNITQLKADKQKLGTEKESELQAKTQELEATKKSLAQNNEKMEMLKEGYASNERVFEQKLADQLKEALSKQAEIKRLQNEISGLTKKIENINVINSRELTGYAIDNQNLQAANLAQAQELKKMQQIQQDADKLRQDVQLLKVANQNQLDSNNAMVQELRQTRDKIRDFEGANALLQQQVTENKRNQQDLEKQIEGLREKEQAVSREISDLRATNTKLQETNLSQNQENRAQARIIAEREAELVAIRGELDGLLDKASLIIQLTNPAELVYDSANLLEQRANMQPDKQPKNKPLSKARATASSSRRLTRDEETLIALNQALEVAKKEIEKRDAECKRLAASQAELKSSIETLNEKLLLKKNELSDLEKTRQAQLKKAEGFTNQAVANIERELNESRAKIVDLESQISSKKDQLREMSATLASKEDLLSKRNEDNETILSENKELDRQLKKTQNLLGNERNNAETLQKELDTLKNERKALNEKLEQFSQRETKLKQELSDLKRDHDQLAQQKASLNDELRAIGKDLVAAELKIENLEKELNNLLQQGDLDKKKIVELESALEENKATLGGKIRELNQQLQYKEQELTQITQESARRDRARLQEAEKNSESLRKLLADKADLEKNLDNLTNEKDAFRAQAEEAAKKIEALVQEMAGDKKNVQALETTHATLKQLGQENEAVKSALRNVKASLEEKEKALSDALRELNNIQGSLTSKESELQAARTRGDELERALADSETRNSDLTQKLLKQKIDEKAIKDLTEELSAANSALETLRAQARLAQDEHVKVATQDSDARAATEKTALKALEVEQDRAKQRETALQEKIDELTRLVKDLTSKRALAEEQVKKEREDALQLEAERVKQLSFLQLDVEGASLNWQQIVQLLRANIDTLTAGLDKLKIELSTSQKETKLANETITGRDAIALKEAERVAADSALKDEQLAVMQRQTQELRDKISALTMELQQITSEHETTKAEKLAQLDRMALTTLQQEEEFTQAQRREAKLQEVVNRLSQEVKDLTEKLAQLAGGPPPEERVTLLEILNKKLDALQLQLRDYKVEAEEQAKLVEQLDTENEQLTTKAQVQAQAEKERAKQHEEQLRQLLSTADQQKAASQAKIDELNNRNEDLTSRLALAEKGREEGAKKAAELEVATAAAQEAISAAAREADQQKAESQAKIAALIRSNEELKSELEKARAAQEEDAKKKEEVAKALAAIERLNEENRRLNDEKEALKAQFEQLNGKLQKQLSELTQEKDTANTALEAANIEMERLKQAGINKGTDLTSVRKELLAANQLADALRLSIAKLEKELGEAQTNLSSKDKELLAAQAQSKLSEKALQDQIDALNILNTGLNATLSAALADRTQEREGALSKEAKMSEELKSVKDAFNSMAEKAQQEIASLNVNNQRLTVELDRLRNELAASAQAVTLANEVAARAKAEADLKVQRDREQAANVPPVVFTPVAVAAAAGGPPPPPPPPQPVAIVAPTPPPAMSCWMRTLDRSGQHVPQ